MEVLAKASYLADLSARPWVDDVRSAIGQYGRLNDKTYSLQTDVSAFGVLYNDTALAEQGLKQPESWDQLLAFCGDARKRGVTAYAMGSADLFFTQQFIYAAIPTLVYKHDPKTDAQMDAGTLTFPKSPGWKETMAKYQQALDAGCFGDRPTGTSFPQAVGNPAGGKALGVIGAYRFSSPLSAGKPDAKLSFEALPVERDPWMMVGAFGGTGVNAKAKNPDLARTFVDFLAQPEIMRGSSAQGTGSLPTIVGDRPYNTDKPGLKTIEKYLDAKKSVTFVDQNWPNPDVQQAMYQATSAMLSGLGSPDAVLTAMQAKWK